MASKEFKIIIFITIGTSATSILKLKFDALVHVGELPDALLTKLYFKTSIL